jgi:Neuraminidase (sialidase)
MAMDSGPVFPLVAEALKDIYSKIEGISKNFTNLEESLRGFLTVLGQKNMIIIENIKKLQGILIELKEGDQLQNTIQNITESISDIRDGIWYLEFQNTLKRFKEKIESL